MFASTVAFGLSAIDGSREKENRCATAAGCEQTIMCKVVLCLHIDLTS